MEHSGCGGKVPVIMAAAVPLTGFIRLVPGGLGQFLRFPLQQLIQRLFHTPSNHPLQLTLEYFFVYLYHLL